MALNNSTAEDNGNIFNIQLNYDVNQTLDLELWDGDFRAISLHSSIEHLASDIKNIKDLLLRMQNYILSKSIEDDKANNIKDLKGVSKVAWSFILIFYESHWDSLMVDGTNRSFRNNTKSKFSPQANKKSSTSKSKNTSDSSYIFLLPLSIPVKLVKKVNEISKYFKKNALSNQKKSYAQVLANNSNSSNIIRDTLKLKKVFLKLQNKKNEIVQKIISRSKKPKPKLNMTTKSVRNRLATEPVTQKVYNVKLSFNIWLVLYMYFILYS